jgi:hypothetical protein
MNDGMNDGIGRTEKRSQLFILWKMPSLESSPEKQERPAF